MVMTPPLYEERQPRKKHVREVPAGYYSAQQARRLLGEISQATLQNLASRGEVRRDTMPLSNISYYVKEDIDILVAKRLLFEIQHIPQPLPVQAEYRLATTLADISGIFRVVADRWGEDHATPIHLRQSWYRVNNRIDFVVAYGPLILGYINMMPYRESVLEEIMSGRKRGWDIRPPDILPFRRNTTYDCFIGIIVRQDVPFSEQYASVLMRGFFQTLCQMYREEGIVIRSLFATSDEEDGVKISQDLGFVKQANKPGDIFLEDRTPPRQLGRFHLDIQTAESPLVSAYRRVLAEKR